MGVKRMVLEKVLLQDLKEIVEIITEEFPFSPFDFESLKAKLKDETFELLKLAENEELIGFIEIELMEDDVARINGLAVKEEFKNKGFGKKILKEALKHLKEEEIETAIVFVKQENKKAKELYKKTGFEFIGLFQEEGSGTIIEQMVFEFGEEKPGYVS